MALVEDIICRDCGISFVFSERERNFYERQGWNKPFRCKACRERKKARRMNPDKYYGLHEVMRNNCYKKRDTKGTVVIRSGSTWSSIDPFYLSPADLFDFAAFDEIERLFDESVGY